jgi:PAS domain S-box-containing protein
VTITESNPPSAPAAAPARPAEAVFTTSRDDVILSWSRGATELFGFAARDVLGKNASVLFPETHREVDALNVRDALAGVVVQNSVVKMCHANGQKISVLSSVLPMCGRDGRIEGVVRVCKDLQPFRDARIALLRAAERIDRIEAGDDPMLRALGAHEAGTRASELWTEGQRQYVRILQDECTDLAKSIEEMRANLHLLERKLGA